jgi:flagellar FliJ protein
MSQRFPLQPVMDLARNDADAAATRLGQAAQRLREAERKLQTLLQYREEYQAKLRASVSQGIDTTHWRNFQLFLAKIDAGIEGARVQVEAAREAARRSQAEWQDRQRRLKAYGVLAERHEREQQAVSARREQRETDERAANTFSRHSPRHRPL